MVIIQVEKKDNYAKIENLHNNDLLTKLEETTINEGVFVEIRIHVGEGEIVATGSERGNSANITMWSEEVM